jgi:hypothetical protein
MSMLGSTSDEAALGPQWARLLAIKEHDGLLALLHPEVDFRALTPRRFWESAQPQGVIETVAFWSKPWALRFTKTVAIEDALTIKRKDRRTQTLHQVLILEIRGARSRPYARTLRTPTTRRMFGVE